MGTATRNRGVNGMRTHGTEFHQERALGADASVHEGRGYREVGGAVYTGSVAQVTASKETPKLNRASVPG
jgi:hypothetical protein